MSAAPIPRPEPRKGFTPLPNECLWDWSRLVSGDAQVLSILYINSELHPPRDKGVPPPKWTRAISNEELAAFGRCTVRAIQIALADLLERKVIVSKKTQTGFAYAIPWDTWSQLPDRPSKVVSIAEAEPADEAADDDPAQPRGEVFRVFSKPQRVRAGGRTRPKELPRAAGKVQFEAESEIEFDARMCEGVLTVRAKAGEQQAKTGGGKGEGKRNVFREQDSKLPVESTKQNFSALHSLLDDYCLHHHATVPNDKLLSKIQQSLGRASLKDFQNVIQARIRSGKVIPMPVFVNLAEDAARGVAARKATAPRQNPETVFSDADIVRSLRELEDDPDDSIARDLLSMVPAERVDKVRRSIAKK